MGQQQLLLLVIGIIIVGVATMTGLEAFQKKQRQFAVDNLLDRTLEIATHAAHWKTKNDPFFMGDISYTNLGTGGLERLGLSDEIANGAYEITSASDNILVITGVSTRYDEIGVRVTLTNYEVTNTDVSYSDAINLSE